MRRHTPSASGRRIYVVDAVARAVEADEDVRRHAAASAPMTGNRARSLGASRPGRMPMSMWPEPMTTMEDFMLGSLSGHPSWKPPGNPRCRAKAQSPPFAIPAQTCVGGAWAGGYHAFRLSSLQQLLQAQAHLARGKAHPSAMPAEKYRLADGIRTVQLTEVS